MPAKARRAPPRVKLPVTTATMRSDTRTACRRALRQRRLTGERVPAGLPGYGVVWRRAIGFLGDGLGHLPVHAAALSAHLAAFPRCGHENADLVDIRAAWLGQERAQL